MALAQLYIYYTLLLRKGLVGNVVAGPAALSKNGAVASNSFHSRVAPPSLQKQLVPLFLLLLLPPIAVHVTDIN